MKTIKICLIPLIIIFLAACSNKAIYDNIQLNNRKDCVKLPHSQYEKCMGKINMSYKEYEKERKEVLDK